MGERRRGALTERQFESEEQRARSATQPRAVAPGRRVVRSLGLPVAAVLLAACFVGGLKLANSLAKPRTRIGATRTPAPGSRVVTLSARKYVVYYEADTTGRQGLSRPQLKVRIESPSGRRLPLRRYEGNFHTGGSLVDARAFLTVQVPRSGRYRIIVGKAAPEPISAGAPRLVLGEPTGTSILRRVAGYVIALLAAIGLTIVVGTAWARWRD
jgi:hypothetical protein